MSRKRRVLLTAAMFAAALMWVTYRHEAARPDAFWGNVVAMTVIAGIVGGFFGAFFGWLFSPWKRR